MATFTENATANVKENVRDAFEEKTGIIGQTMRMRREQAERNDEIEQEVGSIEATNNSLRNTTNTLTNLQISLIQISKNFQAINASFGVVVTVQDESNKDLKAEPIPLEKPNANNKLSPQQLPRIEKEDKDESSMFDNISGLLDMLQRKTAKVPKKMSPQQRARNARKKAYNQARKRGLSRKQAADIAKKAEQKALERAKKQIADRAKKKAASLAAKAAAKKAASEAIKKAAVKIVAKNVAKATAKAIPFVGAAVGIAFAVGKMVEGDWVGAGVEAVSGLGSAITSIPAAIYSSIREVYHEVYGEYPEFDKKAKERLEEVKTVVTQLAEQAIGKKVEPQAPPRPTQKPTAAAVAIPAQGAPTAIPPPPTTVTAAVPVTAPPSVVSTTPKPATGGEEAVKKVLQEQNFDPTATAAILAQTSHESGHFKVLEENLNYSASGLMSIFKKYFSDPQDAKMCERQPQKIANRVYANRMGNGPEESGDGWKYRGRGFIQLTGKSNYAEAGKALGIDLIGNPDLAADSTTAAQIVAWFFKKNAKRITDWANVEQITKVVNGGLIGLADRKKEFESYLAKLNNGGTMVAGKPSTGVQVAQQSTDVAGVKKDMKQQQNNVTVVTVNDTVNRRQTVA